MERDMSSSGSFPVVWRESARVERECERELEMFVPVSVHERERERAHALF